MMTNEKIKAMKSIHPGGYPDVIEFLNGLDIELSYAGNAPTKIKNIVEFINKRAYCTGVFAADIQALLALLKLPVVNDEEWLKPCSEWKQGGK